MNSAKKALRKDDTKFAVIAGEGGHFYVDPLDSGGKYLVRKYDVPEVDDLSNFRGMLNDFEQRFLRNVSRGETVSHTKPEVLDEYIKHERGVLKGLQEQMQQPNAAEGLKDMEALSKRWLATALTARAMRLSKYHIKLRAAGTAPEDKLNRISRFISEDTMEALMLGADLRNKRGHVDTDGIIAEMVGEPRKLFVASITGEKENIKEFYDGRYVKIAQAMKSADGAVEAVQPLAKRHPEINQALHKMAEAAKHKIQILHNDPDYHETDRIYIAARDKAHGLIEGRLNAALSEAEMPAGAHASKIKSKMLAITANDMLQLQKAADIIYDVALTRDPAEISIKQLKLAVGAEIAKSTRGA